jgi:phosphoribosylformylglycinamidine cyclo-ligase
MGEKWTYAKAGVDVEEVSKIHVGIWKALIKTFEFRKGKFGEPERVIGHYASLINIGQGKLLALHVDGVGTKVLIAQLMGKYDTVGIDVVAMCANDLICVGAEPVGLIDYLALQKPDDDLINEVMEGLVKGAKIAGMAVLGGETAVMPDVIKGLVKGKGFDLAALSIGVVDEENLIIGERMQPGDVIVGLRSSGIHSNGLTLARKVLLETHGLSVHEELSEIGGKLGEELLKPTTIYVKPILELKEKIDVHAMAHITGGAFTKLKRFKRYANVGFSFDRMPNPHPIFKLIQRMGNVDDVEMYKTFNMGIGFCVVVGEGFEDDVLQTCDKHGVEAGIVGHITSDGKITIETPEGRRIIL